MALGAFFSAAEVIPLTILTLEAWSFLQLGAQQGAKSQTPFPHFWAVMFLASVGFWSNAGSGGRIPPSLRGIAASPAMRARGSSKSELGIRVNQPAFGCDGNRFGTTNCF
jgi:hypothetical protein